MNGFVDKYTSLAVIDGKPAVSYYDEIKGSLLYISADDVFGDTWSIPATVDVAGDVGQ